MARLEVTPYFLPVCLVHLVSLMQLNKPDRPNRPYEQDRLVDFFSALLGATLGRCEGLLEDRAEAEVGNGIFEIGVQPLEGSHVRVGDVFHR